MAEAANNAEVILLWSSVSSDVANEPNTRRVRDLLDAHKIMYRAIDGAVAENKDERARLWGISGKRAKYPQVFLAVGGATRFVGDAADMDALADSNVELGTLDSAFKDAPRHP